MNNYVKKNCYGVEIAQFNDFVMFFLSVMPEELDPVMLSSVLDQVL